MGGMGGSLSTNNPLVVAAFMADLRREGLIALVLALIAVCAATLAHRVAASPGGAGPGARSGASWGEHPARRLLRIGFGVLWIVDGLLQAQASMPLGMPGEVVSPAASTSPSWVQHLVNNGVAIWTRHPVSAAASAVWIQIGVGLLLLVAPRGRSSQLAGLVAAGWGLLVWIFGEAFGGIFGAGPSWLFGMPGAALLYGLAGVLVALPERVWLDRRLAAAMINGLGLFLLGMAVLQAWPGRGFWQGQATPRATAGALTAMTRAMAQTPQPHALAAPVKAFASFDARHGWAVNGAIVLVLAAMGLGLLSRRIRLVRASVITGVATCLAVWVLVQDLGFLGGVGTDPNSMIPTALLLVAGYVALTRSPAVALADETATLADAATPANAGTSQAPAAQPPGGRRKAALVLSATVAAAAVVALGAVPMAAAAANPNTDTILTEAINGQPLHSDSPAPGLQLTDQRGATVSLASLRGRTVVLTFLDPVCTTDCPLIAQQMHRVDAGLGAAAAKTTAFVAVVANPTYYSQAVVQAFDAQENLDGVANWYFLTGSLPQLQAIWNNFGQQVASTGYGGMAAHSETAYIIDSTGMVRDVLGTSPGSSDADTSSFGTLLDAELRTVMRT